MEIPPEKHIDITAAFQRYCGSRISKTINMPFDYDRDPLNGILIQTWRNGCKGFTVYPEVDESRNDNR